MIGTTEDGRAVHRHTAGGKENVSVQKKKEKKITLTRKKYTTIRTCPGKRRRSARSEREGEGSPVLKRPTMPEMGGISDRDRMIDGKEGEGS